LNDRQAVEEAVRSFLEGIAHGRPQASGELDLRRLEVAHVSGDRATAELDASLTWTLDHPVHGRFARTEALTGPVDLERDGGSWRVVDVLVGGRRRSSSYTEVPGSVELDDLRVDDVVVELAADHTSVELAVENRGARPVVVFEALRGARTLGLWFYLPVPLVDAVEVEPGRRREVRAGWREVFPLDTDELRFVVRAGEVGGSRRLELHFAIRRRPAAEVVLLGRPPRRARMSVRRRRSLQLAPLAVFGALLVLRRFRAAGIVFALEGLAVALAVGYLWLVRRRGRPDSRFVVAALATIAVGVWLAWLDPS
jgi:hypothetical protein